MPPRRTRNASLAGRIVVLTLAMVTVAVVASGVLALAGVYRMTEAEDTSRLAAYRQIILDDLSARLTTAARVMDSISAGLAPHPVHSVTVLRTIGAGLAANGESFDALAVLDTTGTVVAAAPDGRDLTVDKAVLDAALAAPERLVFVWLHGERSTRGRVWLAESFTSGGDVHVLVGRMRAGFAQRVLDDIGSRFEARSVAVVDAEGDLVAEGDGPALDTRRIRLSSEPERDYGVADNIVSPGFGPMRAFWAGLPGVSGLDWHVVVAEPENAPLMRTRSALLPASLTILAGALVAMTVAGVFARRIVEPLHQFERHARAVASGKQVGPIDVARDDELGRLADAFNEMLMRLNSLRELSRLLARSTRLDEVLEGTVSATRRLLGEDVMPAVFLVDEEHDTLDLLAAPAIAGLPPDVSVSAPGGSWPAIALRSREAIAFTEEDVRHNPGGPGMQAFMDAGVRSGLALPLVVADTPIGVLVVLSTRDREYAEAEREILRTFAAQAAMAIENSRLFEEERASRREAEALRDVAEELESPASLAVALGSVSRIAAELMGADCVALRIAARPELGLGDLQDGQFDTWDELYRAHAPHGSHGPVVVPADVAATEGVPVAGASGQLLLIPLVQGPERRGMLALRCGEHAAGFTERQLSLAATIGREVSLALDNAYLLQQARSRAANLETVFRISQAVSSSLQSTVVLNRVLDVVQKIFSAEAVSLMTFDPGKRAIVTAMARGIPDREMLFFETAPGADLPGTVFEAREAKVFHDLAAIDTPLARLASGAGFDSVLAVPLLARGRSTGVLSVFSSRAGGFDSEDVELLQTFATQAALAIDTAQLYGREHRVASVLQSSILPASLPHIPGLDVASVYRPAAQEAEIGGDYYDLFLAPDGRAVLVIADVAGKGVLAATKTSMIRYALRGMAAAGLGPADCARELNRMVAESGDASEIVTVWLGFLDIGARTLTFADAGHPPALLLQPGRQAVERLSPTGPVLGAVAGAEYREMRISLDPGATVLLYTDGVSEARADGKFFGEGRVKRVVKGGGSAAEMVDRLMASVDAFAGSRLRDDAAALVVRLHDGEGMR